MADLFASIGSDNITIVSQGLNLQEAERAVQLDVNIDDLRNLLVDQLDEIPEE